jgi:hypothetical protein
MLVLMGVVLALIPATVGLVTASWKRKPPKDISGLWGYRTKRSMRNQESWDFAHSMCSKRFPPWCLMVFAASEAALFIGYAVSRDTAWLVGEIMVFAQIAALLLMLLPIEKALKDKFG